MAPTKKNGEKKLSEEERKKKELKRRNDDMIKGVFSWTRTIPGEFSQDSQENIHSKRLGIPSYQNGMPIMFRSEKPPASIKFDNTHNVNTQKIAETTGLKFVDVNDKSSSKDYIQNLRASLQSH
jgi:hypothetical protein